MTTEDRQTETSSPRITGALRAAAWLTAGIGLTLLFVADPWNWHPVDTWLLGERAAVTAASAAAPDKRQLYTCSMHPHVIEDEPGSCPACGMDLVPMRMDDAAPASSQSVGENQSQLYTCSMHPQVIKDEPGSCPICGMDLVPMRMDAAAASPRGERKVLFYRNPMDPSITSPLPAKDQMGMDYVPVYADEGGAGAERATVRIDAGVVQKMNVQIEEVRQADLKREIRTVGYLDYDQQRMVTVTTKYPGWIEKVYVNYVGEPVRKGAPLFEIYSPALVQTQQELLSALDFAERMKDAPEEAQRRARALVEAARTRLAYWDISAVQIEALEGNRKVFRTLTVTAPAGGVVMMRMAGLEGMAAKPGMELFHIADLSSLWLAVEAFEDQLAWLRVGSHAEIGLSYFPGETFHGRVRFIEPQVNEKTRTVPLRLEVPNRDGRLRAGMYATVRFRPVVAKDAVLVPSLAVLRTGERNVVVVAQGEGRFTPRDVVLGSEGDGQVQVLSGLRAGERVVTSAQFLLDSESNLREAIRKLIAARSDGGA